MKTEIIQTLTTSFEDKVNKTPDGLEFWFARDLQVLLGYVQWRNFEKVLAKAKESCKNAGIPTQKHFAEVSKSIMSGKGAGFEIKDYHLTRYACYLIAQNGNPSKTEIAFAQTYFAIQTRKYELIQERINDSERVRARQKLSESDKQLSGIIFELTKEEKAIGLIKSLGDKALFNNSTDQMKTRWKVPKTKPLADFAPTVVLKGKDFANELTVFNTKENNLQTSNQIEHEHVENNKTIRNAMIERGITPENLKPEIDIKKIERKLVSESKKVLKGK